MNRRQFFTLTGTGMAGFAIDKGTTIYGGKRLQLICGDAVRIQAELSRFSNYERVSSGALMRQMVDAIRENRLASFRVELWNKRFLIIEHVHRLKNKQGTTMEVVEMIEGRAKHLPPIILTSYETLEEMKGNEEYLRDFRELFEWQS